MEQLQPVAGPLSGMLQAAYQNVNTQREHREMYEYLLVANPDEEMSERVWEEKQSFYGKYEQKISANTRPHITIANFFASEMMEDTIGRWIQRICSQQQSFRVVLNNFSGIPPHKVYIRIQNHRPFQLLARQLKAIDSYVQSNGCPPAKLITHPHLTLAGHVPEDMHTKALFDYAQREFTGDFIVNELVLLRRKRRSDACEKVNVFRLLPEVAPIFYHD